MDAKRVYLFDAVLPQVDEIISHYKTLAKDGWTVTEIWELAQSGVASFMRLVEAAGEYTSVEKRDAVLKAAALLYDRVIAPLDIPNVPEFLERSLVDPAIKKFFLQLVAGAIDSLTNVFNRVGWDDATPGTNGANGGTIPSTPPTPSGFVPY